MIMIHSAYDAQNRSFMFFISFNFIIVKILVTSGYGKFYSHIASQLFHEMARIDIKSVFDEYLQKEQQFEQEIEERNKLRREIRNKDVSRVFNSSSANLLLNLKKSRIRNQTLLKDLEMSRARLRTYASYTPTDAELQQISLTYRNYLRRNTQNMES